jgi:hypothetical protein
MSVRRDVGADDPRGWLPLATSIAALALLASATSLGNGFAYDDRFIILENKRAHSLSAPWQLFGETYWPNIRGAALYRPLTILLYAAEWVAGGGSPLVYHVVNVALYAAVSVLVLWLALQVLPRGAAWAAAALFAVHPVHVEAVGNVVGQAELWTAVAMVGAVGLYLRDRREGLPLPRQSAWIIVALYFAGMLVKENMIVLPALLVVAESLLVYDESPWRERADRLFTLLVWMGLFAALFLYLRSSILGDIGGDVSHPSLRDLGIVPRSLLMLGLAPEFGRLLLWPAHLFADYSPRQVPTWTELQVGHLSGALLLMCLVILFAVSVRRAPIVAFGLAWFAIAYAPVSNVLIPTGILIAERTLLVPSVGIVMAAAFATPWALEKLRPRPNVLRILAAGAFATVLTLGIAASAERQLVWKDSDAVFRSLAVDAPMNFKAHYAYGGQLFEQRRPVEGEREWRYAIALFPEYYGVYVDLAHKYREAHVCQAAVPNYRKALALEPALPLARVGLVACYLELAQYRKARAESRYAIADGYYKRAFEFMIDRADSALVANDSLDATNRFRRHGKPAKPASGNLPE